MSEGSSKTPGALKSSGLLIIVVALYFIVNGISLKEGAGLLGESVLGELFKNIDINQQFGNIGTGVVGLLLGGGLMRQGFKKSKEDE
jgi:hypothetical protein